MSNKNSFKEDLYNFSVGFCMGGANVIPGVSGGTMLFIMGAFTKLTDAISDIANLDTLKLFFSGKWKALYQKIQIRFLAGIILGVLFSFATLAKLIVWMLEKYPLYTYAFFFGLIAASIITVNKQMKKWTPAAFISFMVSAAIAFGIIMLIPVNGGSQWYMMILYGAICIIAMILPGLSGSFLLLIFGQYERIWKTVGDLAHFQIDAGQLLPIVFFAIGAVIGLGAFVHILNFLLKRYYNETIAALIGFMVGAIPRLWPWQHESGKSFAFDVPVYDITLLWTLLCIISGLILILLVEFSAGKKQMEK